ncbi:hypothetical protein N0V88_008130 [Collariella sp. IMI 366227]|nr:hypothetical protein N0V88_008130 [Collariella sp. IMI 366227]
MHDHRELEACYKAAATSTTQDGQQHHGNQFIWELAKHSAGVEMVLYPAFEQYLGVMGKQMAETDRKDNHEANPNYLPSLSNLWRKFADHITDEETNDLPALEAKLSPDESQAMSNTFSRIKSFVPSWSHPSTGEHAPFETVMGLLMTPMDRLADLFRKFPEHSARTPETAEIDTPLGPLAMLHD